MRKILKYQKIMGEIGLYIFSLSIMVSKGGMNIGLGLMIFGFLLGIKNKESYTLEKEEKYILILIILIPIFSLLSVGGVKSFIEALEKIYRYIPVFLIPIFLKEIKKYWNVICCIYISIVVNFINGMKFYQSKKWNFNWRYESYGVNLLDDAHMFAMLSFIILGVLFYTIAKKKYVFSFLSVIVYILALIGVLLSQSRGAWLSVLGGIFFFLVFSLKKKKNIIGAVIIVLSLILGVINTEKIENNRYVKRFLSITNIESDSPKIRILMWEGAVYSFKQHFIFGTGKDNSAKYILEYLEKNDKYSEVRNKKMLKIIAQTGNMHNMYFSSLAEEGILFFYLVGVWGYILWQEIKFHNILKKGSLEYYIISSCIALTIAFYITGLTENAWKNLWKTNTYLLGVGIYLAIKKMKRVSNEKEKNFILY